MWTKGHKAPGLPAEGESLAVGAIEDEDANKQQKILQEVLELDEDADGNSDILPLAPAGGWVTGID